MPKPLATLCFVFVAVATGCMPPPQQLVETEADVFRFVSAGHGLVFYDCTLTLGHTREMTQILCGEPLDTFRDSDGRTCLLYDSLAHAIGASSATAPYFLACFQSGAVVVAPGGMNEEGGEATAPPPPPVPIDPDDPQARLVHVYGLREPPQFRIP